MGTPNAAKNRDIVAIGGSTGAIGPLRSILSSLPQDIPAAIAVVLHVPAESTGIFTAIASTETALPVKHAEDGEKLEHGTVYLAAPNHHFLVLDNKVRLGSGPRENLVRPAVDPLFRSAALSYGSRAIGVILSGMLNDGASGLAAIKHCGGVALVQAPQGAVASEMPLAALEASPVDGSFGVRELGAAIVEKVRERPGPQMPTPPEIALEVEIAAGSPLDSTELARIAKPSVFTCPDCGGVLSEIEKSKPPRFRCQVGHAYSGRVLLSQQESQVDEAMRIALRIIEERAALVTRMGKDAAAVGRIGIAEMYEKRAAEYRAHAEIIRSTVLDRIQNRKSEALAESEARSLRASE
ncbi:chemotaxis protein CheB [Mesorhizobium sp. SP-1A]|uniref:chemotaxis protein CheB n=1 Tax=Mesorhizobium sp. SP-1A TaxID=3077840 RepID=UPI0028F70EBE|nr:chemotaxis protein CheB [Mesorhizobium sp. SP-1A]